MRIHHVAMSKYPAGTTAEDIIADCAVLSSGTPAAGEPLVARAIPQSDAALQSGGFTMYNAFGLAPARPPRSSASSINVETGVPHVMDGMVTVFAVE